MTPSGASAGGLPGRLLWVPLALYYAIGFAGLAWEPFHQRSLAIINSGPVRNHQETVLIEHLEAFFWLAALALYAAAAVRRAIAKSPFGWLVFFAVVCLAALGEETSWGQHYLGFSPHGAVRDLNVQQEFNLHNLHISRTLGLPEDHRLYRILGNATLYLNPLFYLFCIAAWLALPLTLDRWQRLGSTRLFRAYPRQGRSFRLAFAFFTALYIAVDFLVFDVGELYELTLATAGCATAMGSFVPGRGDAP